MQEIKKHIQNVFSNPYIVLLLVTVAGYWSVASFQYCVKYDMIDCYLPWRYFVGESLQQHLLPLWNPYSAFGQPIHADPQSGCWYPFAWIIGYCFGYNIYSIAFEFILHIFIAGVGFYQLIGKLKMQKSVALIAAISYILSGFFIGNSQHLTYIISGTWIPFIIGAFIDLYHQKNFYNSLKLALFAFLLVTGGYPAFSFILLYFTALLLLGGIYVLIKEKKDNKGALRFFLFTVLSGVMALLMSCITIISVYGVLPYLSRGAGVDLASAQLFPVSPRAFISLILPYALAKNKAYFDTDISMADIYMGLLMLVFFFVSLTIKHKRFIWVLMVFGAGSLLAAMGKYLPVREWLYHNIPLMNLFRFPGLFRYFTILGFLVFASDALQCFFQQPEKYKSKIKYISFTLLGIIIIFPVYQLCFYTMDLPYFLKSGFFREINYSTIHEHIFSQGIIQAIFIITLIFIITRLKKPAVLLSAILLFTIAETVVCARLVTPYTTHAYITTKEVSEVEKTFPNQFPIPANHSVSKNTDQSKSKAIFWKNMNIFYKQIGKEGFTPFRFYGYEMLTDSFPRLLDSITQNIPVYLSSDLKPLSSLKNQYNSGNFSSKTLFILDSLCIKYSDTLKQTLNDSAYFSSFSPEKMIITAQTSEPQMLTLLQSNFNGWKATVNNKSVPIITSNLLFMSVPISAGRNIVEFQFEVKPVEVAFLISLISIFLFTTLFIILKLKRWA